MDADQRRRALSKRWTRLLAMTMASSVVMGAIDGGRCQSASHHRSARTAHTPPYAPPRAHGRTAETGRGGIVVYAPRRHFVAAPVPGPAATDGSTDRAIDPNTGASIGAFGDAFGDAAPVSPINPAGGGAR